MRTLRNVSFLCFVLAVSAFGTRLYAWPERWNCRVEDNQILCNWIHESERSCGSTSPTNPTPGTQFYFCRELCADFGIYDYSCVQEGEPGHTTHNAGRCYCRQPSPPPDCDPMGTNQMNCLADNGIWENCSCNYSPIIVQLTPGARYDLTGVEDGVLFDYQGDGVMEHTAWTKPNSPVAFLVLDRNGNGTIDSGAELFGSFTRKANGELAENGFTALADLEAGTPTQDGLIDARDPAYHRLRLWLDGNHNGISEADELIRLEQARITTLFTWHRRVNRRDEDGNIFRFEGRMIIGSPWIALRRIYDVYLRTGS